MMNQFIHNTNISELYHHPQQSTCKICMRVEKCTNIFNLNRNGKNASDIFQYCTGVRLWRKYDVVICENCMSDLINCQYFIEKCRKLSSIWQEINIQPTSTFGPETNANCTITNIYKPVEENLHLEVNNKESCNSNNPLIKIEIDEERIIESNDDQINSNYDNFPVDYSMNLGADVADEYYIDENIKIEDSALISVMHVEKADETARLPDSNTMIEEEINSAIMYVIDDKISKKKIGRYICKYCSKIYKKKTTLRVHIYFHILEKYSTNSQQSSMLNNKTPTVDGRSAAGLCKPAKKNLDRQKNQKPTTTSKTNDYHTKMNKFTNSGNADGNVTTTPRGPRLCEICFNTFKTKTGWMKHVYAHFINDRYYCEYCGKKMKNSHHLKYHMTIHTGEMPLHQCEKCGKGLSSATSLARHYLTHDK